LVCGSDEPALRVLMLRRMCVLTSLKCFLSNFVVRDATVVHHLIALSVIRCRTIDSAFWSPLSGDNRMFSPNFSVHAGWQQGFVKTSDPPRLYWLAQHRQQVVFGRSPKVAVTERDAEIFWSLGAYSSMAVQYSDVLRV